MISDNQNSTELVQEDTSIPIFENVSLNKARVKRRKFNEYSVVTELVKAYKLKKDHAILLEIISNLEGIINSYTIVLTPVDPNQPLHFTKYILKFVCMFLTPEERANVSNQICFQAVQRVRWMARFYTYEDLYSKLIEMIIEIITKMRVIGTCDCVYYIQKMIRFKVYDLVMNTTKDVYSSVQHLSSEAFDDDGDSIDSFESSFEDRLEFNDNEDKLIYELFYKSIGIESLVNEFEFYAILTQYEKYILYLRFCLQLSDRQIKSVITHKTIEEIVDDLRLLEEKLLDVGQEYLDM